MIMDLYHQRLGFTSICLKVAKMSIIAFLFLLFFFPPQKKMCKKLLSRFGNCPKVVAFDDYVATCTEDMCNCEVNSSHSDLVSSCICSTLNQYSRDCVLSKGDPGEWRTKELCCK